MVQGATDPGARRGTATGTAAPTRERERAVKSVEHAAEVLTILASQHGGLGVTVLAQRLDLNVSSVHHILRTLLAYQLVEQSPNSKLYRLGIRSLRLGQAYLAGLDLYAIAMPLLKRAAHECGETITLASIDGLRVAELATIPGAHTVRSLGSPTSRHNAHATALGKVILAGLTSDDLREHVAQVGLARFTVRTVGSYRALETELARVRERGYALDLEELEPGLCCVAAGIRNHADELIAALAISAPSSRFGAEQGRCLTNLGFRTARQISARLGHAAAELDESEEPPDGDPPASGVGSEKGGQSVA